MTRLQDARAEAFQQRERAVLATAVRLLAGDDWQQVTIEQIAQAAGIGKGTIYKHFSSKDELYARLALDFHAQVRAELDAIDPSLPVLERLREIFRVQWGLHLGRAELRWVVQYCEREDVRRGLRPEVRARFEALDVAFGERLFALLREGVVLGALPNKPLRAQLVGAQSALFGALGHAHRCRLAVPHAAIEGPESDDDLRDDVIAFVLSGLTNSASAVR